MYQHTKLVSLSFFRKQSSMLPCRRKIVWTLSWSATTWRRPSMTRYSVQQGHTHNDDQWPARPRSMVECVVYCTTSDIAATYHTYVLYMAVTSVICWLHVCRSIHLQPYYHLIYCMLSLYCFFKHRMYTCDINVMPSISYTHTHITAVFSLPIIVYSLAQSARVSHFTHASINTHTQTQTGNSLWW